VPRSISSSRGDLLQDADNEACVGVGGRVGTGYEVVGLENKLAVISVAVAFGKSRDLVSYSNLAAVEKIICVDTTKNTSTIALNHDRPYIVLYFVFNKGGFAGSLFGKWRALHVAQVGVEPTIFWLWARRA
jgi:hypothetical protein